MRSGGVAGRVRCWYRRWWESPAQRSYEGECKPGGGRSMTRRDLGRLTAAAAALASPRKGKAQNVTSKYTSALNGIESKVDVASFDPIAYTLKLHDEAPLKLTFKATNRAEAEAWQKRLRPKVE